jgi:hypothetical protein
MTPKQIWTNVNRIPEFDVNRILRWDVGRALTRPVINPLAKAFCGYIVGIAAFGLAGMMVGAILGMRPNDDVVRLLSLALGVVFALTPNTPPLRRDANANSERPAGA